jgi:nucleoside-diphosphate-sugar epimerase
MQSFVVLGGGGFLGRSVIAGRRAGERCKVVVRQPLDGSRPVGNGLEWHVADLLDAEALDRVIDPGDVVLNVAHAVDVPVETNLDMIDRVIESCRRRGARRLVHCSTAVVVGRPTDDVVTELTVPSPVTEYQRTKLRVEERVRAAAGDLDIAVLRPTAIAGAGGRNLVSLAGLLERQPPALSWLRAALFGSRPMHLVPVSRVASAMHHLAHLTGRLDGRLFIVSADDDAENNYADVERVLRRELGLPARRAPVPALPRPLLSLALTVLRRPETNLSRRYEWQALRATGFSPTDSVADAIREFAAARRAGVRLPGSAALPSATRTTA